MHELDRADVEAARRLRGDQHLRVACDLAGDDDLLLVAAGERGGARLGGAAAHVELVQQLARRRDDARRMEEAVRRERLLRVVVQHEVLGERELEYEPAPVPVLRDVTQPVLEERVRARAGQVLAGDGDRARARLAQAGDRVDQLGLPVAVDAGDRDDLAGADAERHAANRLEAAIVVDVKVVDLQQHVARLRRRLVDAKQHVAADHHPRQQRLGRARAVDRVDLAPAPQHGDAVGDLEHLVQLVRDEDDGHPLCDEALEDLEQLHRLLRRQHRGRLVEDQDVGAAIERLEDLDALLLAHGDVADARVRVDVEAELLGELADAAFGGGGVEKYAVPPRLRGEHDVLGDGHHRDEHEVLVHHPDPGGNRAVRRADVGRLAVQQDLALVGPVEPVEDVHQRRLAGAVLAEQCMHLAGAEIEVDVVVREHTRKALGDPAQLEDGRVGDGSSHGRADSMERRQRAGCESPPSVAIVRGPT